MKYASIFIAIMLFAFTNAFAQPKLEIEPNNEYNWGNVKPGDNPLKAKVKIHNRGDLELHVKNIRPGCGCTTAPLDKNIIAPGDFATLDITLNFGTSTGEVTKSILIESIDPSRPSFHYYIKCNVVRPIVAFPQYFVFNEMYFNKETTSSLQLRNTTDKPVTITGIELTPKSILLNVAENTVIPPNGELKLEATYMPTHTGTNHLRVVLKTDHPEAPTVEISGWGNPISTGEGIINNEK